MCFSCVFYLLWRSYQRIEVKKREWFNLRQGKRKWATFQQSLGCLVVELVLLVSSWMFLGVSHAKSSKYLQISWKLSIRNALDMLWFYLRWFVRCISKKQPAPTKKSADYGKSVDFVGFVLTSQFPIPPKTKESEKFFGWICVRKLQLFLPQGGVRDTKKIDGWIHPEKWWDWKTSLSYWGPVTVLLC